MSLQKRREGAYLEVLTNIDKVINSEESDSVKVKAISHIMKHCPVGFKLRQPPPEPEVVEPEPAPTPQEFARMKEELEALKNQQNEKEENHFE